MRNFTTRFLLVGLLVTFCLSINSYAQQRQVLETQSYTGKLVRTTPKLADIDRTTMYGKPFVITRDMDGIIGIGDAMEETEERIERGFASRNSGKGKETGALQDLNTHNPQVPGSSIINSFDGQTSPGLSPTDNNMAAGPNHVIQIVNNTAGSQFTIYNKTGGIVQGPTILASITGFPGFGDPVVLYDQLADRWVLMEFGPNTTPIHTLNIAVSTTGNPTGTWKIYQYQDLTFFIDYEKMSVWHNAYYLTSNDFNNAGTTYLGSSVYSMDRAAMIAGAPTTTMIRTRLTDAGQNFYNMGTIGLEGMATSSQSGLFAYPIGPTTLNVFEVIPNFGGGTQTIGPNTALTIASYATPPGTVPQQGGGSAGTLGERMMFKLNYRKNGATESIVMTHTVGNAGLAAVRWYELRRVAGNWTVYQQGTVTGADGNSRFMGGISMDGCGNIALMYDVSGATANPSIRYTGRNSFDPLNTMTLPEQVIINAGVGHPGNTRWGDYNTTVQDYSGVGTPLDGTFWSTSQYGNQSTRIAKYTITNGCAPTVSLAAAGATLVAENCTPANGVIDPNEIVTVSLCVQNTGTLNTTNLVGTLQATGGVTVPSGPQNYGVVVGGGPAVCRNFSFTANGSCGGTITATLQLQDGATNYGTVTYTFTMGVLSTVFTQNFDAVVAPALPAGWVATAPTNLTGAPLWVTSSAGTPAPPAFSAPNAIFSTDPGNLLDNRIETPGIAITTASAKLSFQNNFNLESGFDGGVLEISIPSVAAGAFQDILVAGGSFGANGYNGTISGAFANPIAGRQAWTGNNGGFQLVTVNLPAAAAGQTIKLRWREGSDNSVAAVGWRVDDIVITDGYTCSSSCTPPPPPPCIITCPANITQNNTLNQCGAVVNYPAPTGSGVCGTITATPPSGSFFPVGTTVVNVRSNVLYDQTGASGGNAISSQNFEASLNAFDNQAADDFVVPGGQVWTVSQVAVGGLFFNGVGIPTTTATVTFYNNSGSLPGSVVQSFSAVPVTGGANFTATLPSNVVLNPGTYWVSVQVDMDFTPNGQWGWSTYGATNVNSEAVWRNPGGGFGTPCTNYAPVVTGGCIPSSNRNLIFRLIGSNSVPNCSFTVTVLDVQAPTITCPANITVNAAAGLCTASVVTPNAVTADNCSVSKLTWVMTGATTGSSPLTGINNVGTATFNGGVTTVTYTASDPSNNTATCSFTVTVNDTQAPTITCPANISVNAAAGLCNASVVTPNPTTADNCAVTKLTWTLTGATTGTSPATGINNVGTRTFNVGVTTVTYIASDAFGNSATCSFTVTVIDNQAPTITCPANISGTTPIGSCTLTVVTPNPTTADNCGVTVLTWALTGATTGVSPATGINYVGTMAFNIGVTTVTYTAKDASNNATSCSYTITVADGQLPVISAQPTTRTVCEGTSTTFSVTATNTLTYQWQIWNGTAWVNTGTNSSTLTINPTTLAMNTNTFRVLLNGLCSVVTSANASLYVNKLPAISIAASRIPILLPGESVNLVATVDPTGGSFVWLKNGVAVPGVTGATLSGLTVDDIGSYRARYTDLNGCVQTSNEIIVSGAPSGNLYVFPNPNFGQFSVRFFNQVGESATVTVYDAKGAKIYQRQMVTTTAYTRLDIDLGPTLSSGVYIVEVVNAAGKRMGAKRVVVRHP